MRAKSKVVFVFSAATVLFFWKIFLTKQYSLLAGSESINQTYSWLSFEVRSLQHGSIPAWDSFAFGGHSFVGEMQTAAYYPVHWLLALAPLDKNGFLPTALFYALFGLNHVLAGLFFFWMARELGFDRYVSLVAGMCFTFGGFMGRVEWPHMLESALWTPLIFGAILRALRTTGFAKVSSGALASLGLGLSILAGGLHVVIMQVILVVSALGYAAYVRLAPQTRDKRRSLVSAAVTAAAVLLGGAAVGAVQLLPSHEYAERSIRFLGATTWPSARKIPYELLQDRLSPQGFVSVLFPTGFDSHFYSGEGWAPYIGVFAFAMALLGVWVRRDDIWVRYFAALSVVSLVYTMGAFTGLHGVAYAVVPFLWMAREATRFTFLTQFAMCVLMAFGLDAIRQSRVDEFTRGVVIRTLKWTSLAAGAFMCIPLLFGRELGPWTGLSLILILMTCALASYLVSTLPSRTTWSLVAAFVFLDLLSFNWTGLPKNRKEGNFESTLVSIRPACDFLLKQPGPFRVSVDTEPGINIGDACGVPILLGGGVTLVTGYGGLLATPGLLNARYHLKPASTQDPGPVYQDPNWKLYEDKQAYPRAWIVHQAIQQSSNTKPDFHQAAVFQDSPSVSLKPEVPGNGEQVTWRTYDRESIQLSAELRSDGLLVLSEIDYPGWAATVNGSPARIWSVDGGLRAVAVPKGTVDVAMRYAPFSVRMGAALSITAASVLSIFVFFRKAGMRRWLPSAPGPLANDQSSHFLRNRLRL